MPKEEKKRKGGAQPGNKFGVGFGRPPNPGYSNEEVLIIGEEFLKWMKECDDDPNCDVVHLSEFYCEIKRIPPKQWESICQRPCFLEYYDVGRKWMGKRIMKNQKLSQSYGNRFLGIYFTEIKAHEREEMEHKIDYEVNKKAEAEKKNSTAPNEAILKVSQDTLLKNVQLEEANKKLQEQLDVLIAKANSVLPASD